MEFFKNESLSSRRSLDLGGIRLTLSEKELYLLLGGKDISGRFTDGKTGTTFYLQVLKEQEVKE